jgi:hypothetical protein
MPTPPSYSQLLNPSENLAELIAYQNNLGLTAGLASGAEPYDVLIGKAAFNVQQQSPLGAVNSVVGTVDEIDVSTAGGVATVSLPDVISLIGKTVVGGDFSAATFSGAFTGNLAGVVTGACVGNVIGNVTGNVTGSAGSVTGIVPVSNGGTGQSLFADGEIMIGKTFTSTAVKSTLTAGTNVAITNGSGSITIAARNSPLYIYNVRDYGAVGDGVANDTVAVQAAATALQASYNLGSMLYFPAGTYRVSSITQFTNVNPFIRGDGAGASLIEGIHASAYLFDFNGCDGGINNISFTTSVARSSRTALIRVRNCEKFSISELRGDISGDLFYFEQINWMSMSDIVFRNNRLLQGVMVQTKGVGLNMNNVVLSNNNSLVVVFPDVVVPFPIMVLEGSNTTGTNITNCGFSGGGPLNTYTGATIASTPADFTVTFTGVHDFQINEYIVIAGAANAAYNTYWRIESVTATEVVVLSTANPGADAPTSVISVPCCVTINNRYGAYNESTISGTMFEAVGYPQYAMSASLYINGTKRNTDRISGWKFDNCYFDYGKVGAMLIGGGIAGTGETVARIQFNGTQCEGLLRLISVEQSSGVVISDLQGAGYPSHTGVAAVPNSSSVYVWGRTAALGLQISNSNLGVYSLWRGEDFRIIPSYGLLIEGASDAIVLTGCNLQGSVASALGQTDTMYIKSSGNQFYQGTTVPPLLSSAYPVIASAATITVPWNDIVVITGTTNIDTISGGWEGREIILICTGGVVLTNAGNIVVGVTVVAGRAQKLIMRSTNWVVMQ